MNRIHLLIIFFLRVKSYFGDFRLEPIELRANHSLNQRIRIIEFFKPEHSATMRETIHICAHGGARS